MLTSNLGFSSGVAKLPVLAWLLPCELLAIGTVSAIQLSQDLRHQALHSWPPQSIHSCSFFTFKRQRPYSKSTLIYPL